MKVTTFERWEWNPALGDWELVEEESFDYDGPVAEAKGGGGGTTTTIQKADPWSGVQPHLLFAFNEARRLYESDTPQYFPGQTYAPEHPLEQLGRSMALNQAMTTLPSLAAQQQGALSFSLGPVLSPSSNPFLQQYAGGLASDIFRAYQEQVKPSLDAQAIARGAYGGYRDDAARAMMLERVADRASRAVQGLYSQAYGQGLETMARGMALAPQVMQSALMPAGIVSGAGEAERAWQQRAIDEAMARWEFEQNKPYMKLGNLMQVLNYGSPYGVRTATQTMPGPSTAASLIGGGLLGAGVLGPMIQNAAFNAIGPMTGLSSPLWALSGPWGLAAGAVLGALGMGLFD